MSMLCGSAGGLVRNVVRSNLSSFVRYIPSAFLSCRSCALFICWFVLWEAEGLPVLALCDVIVHPASVRVL